MDSQRERELAKGLGKAIAKRRVLCGLTQEEVGERLELGTEQVSRIERGAAFPTVRRLVEFAEVFGCSVDTLLTGGSDLPQDHGIVFQRTLSKLTNKKDREFVIGMVEQLSEYLGGTKPE
jgi:transcriptional regulator with XRE-family HTH domain